MQLFKIKTLFQLRNTYTQYGDDYFQENTDEEKEILYHLISSYDLYNGSLNIENILCDMQNYDYSNINIYLDELKIQTEEIKRKKELKLQRRNELYLPKYKEYLELKETFLGEGIDYYINYLLSELGNMHYGYILGIMLKIEDTNMNAKFGDYGKRNYFYNKKEKLIKDLLFELNNSNLGINYGFQCDNEGRQVLYINGLYTNHQFSWHILNETKIFSDNDFQIIYSGEWDGISEGKILKLGEEIQLFINT